MVKLPGSSLLRINDIRFEVPPEQITIIKRDFADQVATLRTQTSTIVKSGRRMITFVIDLYFATGYNALTGEEKQLNSWVNDQLAPLLIQIRKCPFVSIENEKLRKEIFGDTDNSNQMNLVATVKAVSMSVEARQSEMMKVSITCKSFNHFPYSPDFNFKDILPNGDVISQSVPGSLFKEFYKSGTTHNGRLVNTVSGMRGTGMRFIYKQYYELDFEVANLQDLIRKSSTKEEFELRAVKDVFESGDVGINEKLAKLATLGWVEEKNITSTNKNSKLLYRYKIFDISESVALESNALIVESGSAVLETKTPDIPLQSHAIPTSQFLGCSDSRITFQIFANAELKDEKPIGTSRQLAALNKIIEVVNQNALKFHRLSFNDSIFIRHPLAKLCKYKQYIKKNSVLENAFNPATGKLEVFDPNEYLAIHILDTSSQTVPGHPYCSRFTISMVENYRNEESDKRFLRDGGTNKVYESQKGMIRTLAKRYGIVWQSTNSETTVTETSSVAGVVYNYSSYTEATIPGFTITDRPLAESAQEREVANKLINTLNVTSALSGIKSVEDALKDTNVVDKRTDELYGPMQIKGIDPHTNPPPLSSDRLTELSDDLINIISRSDNERFSDYNESMDGFVTYNLVPNDSAYPDMMLPTTRTQPDFAWYNLSDELHTNRFYNKLKTKVLEDRKEIGEIHAGEYLNADLPEKLKPYEFQPSKWVPAPAANNMSVGLDPETGVPFAQAPLDPEQQNVVVSRSIDTFNENTYTMRRAMPTFKIYFKDDLPEDEPGTFSRQTWRSFSDVYDTNAIIDIRLAKDENNPADLLIIRMTNSRKDILSKFHEKEVRELSDVTAERKIKESAGSPAERDKLLKSLDDKKLDGIILKEGTRIELRLGYDDNPNNLSVEFAGRVMSSSGTDIIELVCQGDGVELIQELKGVGVQIESGTKGETTSFITELLEKSPEVSSFGNTGALTKVTGQSNWLWQGFGGRSAIENIFAPPLYNTWDKLGEKTLSYTGWGATIGSIVPGLGTLLGAKVGAVAGAASDLYNTAKLFLKGVPYIVYEQTLWDVLQELTLRHPGTICGVVPYDNRSTIFFGYPEQLYFFRGPTYAERIRYRADKIALQERGVGSLNITSKTRRDIINTKASPFGAPLGRTTLTQAEVAEQVKNPNVDKSKILSDALKPYRSYHVITSEHDIVMNDMIVTSENVFNAIEVVHPKTSGDANVDGSVGFSSYDKTDTIAADDDLIKNYIKKQTLVFHNAHSNPLADLPERYASSSLVKSLENAYSGKITILGRPGIKPHDVVFVEDNYNEVYGPVKVGAVTQVFSYQTGWITEIHPKMIVGIAGTVTIDQVAAMKTAAKTFALQNFQIFNSSFYLEEADRDDKSWLTKFTESMPSLAKEGLASAYDMGVTAMSITMGRRAFAGSRAAASEASAAAAASGAGKIASASKAGSVYMKALGKAVKVPLLGFALDYAVTTYLSWSKNRQPIAFLPVHRRGVPWYSGLHGLKNNTELDAAKKWARGLVEDWTFIYESAMDRLRSDD